MNVLLSAYACRPNAGTEPGNGWNWATHLAARGINVHVLTAPRYRNHIEEMLETQRFSNLRVSYVSVPWRLAACFETLHYILWQWCALKTARKLSQDTTFDLAHHVSYGSIHIPSQLWRLGIPLVFGPVGGGQTAPPTMLGYFGHHKRKEQIRTALTRALRFSPFHRNWLRRMTFVLAANQPTLKVAENLGCKRSILMCDAGLPESFFALGPRTFTQDRGLFKLLWVGRMLPLKALPLALDALARVGHQVVLTIIGDGIEPRLVRQMIAARKLQNRVSWQGRRLPWGEVRTAYLEHDAILFTSLRDSFGCQLLEAMSSGLPVIALDINGAHDFVPCGAGIKVQVGQPEETIRNLANAIETYISLSVEARNTMSKVAWDWAKHFTWTARAELAETIYKDILA